MRIVITFIYLIYGVLMMGLLTNGFSQTDLIRKAAVAGSFYEKNPKMLRKVVSKYLTDVNPHTESSRFLICPHAGFIFSGSVAAKGYAVLDTTVKQVFIIGPSHHKAFSGIAVSRFQQYETPLGKVTVDKEIVAALRSKQEVIIADGFDEPEHCLEVQLPFLQVRLKNFTIIPILTGSTDPKQVALMLLPYLDSKTAVIASSDLSHYEHQKSARVIDDASIKTILKEDVSGKINACGDIPIRVLMHIGKMKKLKPLLIDARTSYETAPEHCPESRVVGYASIAYISGNSIDIHDTQSENNSEMSINGSISENDKKLLLQYARESLEASVRGKRLKYSADSFSEILKENRGCFVTLKKNGNLRGCIGYIEPIKPLYQAVIENARNAALSDPRFPNVSQEELDDITVEVSVLTIPEPLLYSSSSDLLDKLKVGIDGVILEKDGYHSTFLPQVWDQLPEKRTFLEHLSLKGGMTRDGWKTANVKTYSAIHFNE